MKKIISLILGFLIFIPVLRAQDKNGSSNLPVDESQIVYVIRDLDFDITGRTMPYYLILNGEFKEGERIQGKENFERYLARRIQLLNNHRVLDDTATKIEYFLREPEGDGAIPVTLLVHVKDTWNFIILPYPKYDSNEGFSLTLKARDYNFLGTMSPLRLDIGYLWSTVGGETNNIFFLEIDSDIPFQAFGLNWNFNFDHILNYTIGDPLEYTNVTGVSVELPAGFTTVTLGIDQYLFINEKNSQADIDKYDDLGYRMDGAYAATELYSLWKIPTGVVVGDYGEVFYTPRVSGRIAYRHGGVDEPRRPVAALSHSLRFGSIDWIGNYREGLAASIGNTNNFYFLPNDFLISLNADATLHHRFSKLFGISARMQYRHWFNGLNYSAASAIRGFPINNFRAENMLSLNLDFPFRILRFAPSEWVDNPKYWFLNRAVNPVLNFDVHLSPFIDIAFLSGYKKPFEITGGKNTGEKINFGDALFGGGFEIIIFPDAFRSLYLRISAGYNLNKLFETGKLPKWDELFIGIGHHY